jgi:DNA-binding CsgD family transcriptional regulator
MTTSVDSLRLAQAFELDPNVSAILLEADGSLVYVNRAARSVYSAHGEPEVDRTGQKLQDFLPAEWVEERLAWFRKALASERPIAVQHLYRGQLLSVTIYPLFDKSSGWRILAISRRTTAGESDPSSIDFDREETKFVELGVFGALTPRELEVFVLLGTGISAPEAAASLHRSPKTIERHKSAIGRKLGASTMASIATLAAKSGIQERHLALRRVVVPPTVAEPAAPPQRSVSSD